MWRLKLWWSTILATGCCPKFDIDAFVKKKFDIDAV